jgi:hypothetical protein
VRFLAERLVLAGERWMPPGAGPAETTPGTNDLAELRQRLRLAETRLAAVAREAIDIPQIARLIDGTPRSPEEIATFLGLEIDPSSVSSWLALAWRLLEFRGRAAFGRFTFTLSDRSDTERADDEPLDFNRARSLIRRLLPTDVGVRKMSCDAKERTITLRLDFPDVVERRYENLLNRASALTGWTLHVHPSANQQALILETRRLLKNPGAVAVHLAERCVEVNLDDVPDDWEALVTALHTTTGFDLKRRGERDLAAASEARASERTQGSGASHDPGPPRVSVPDEGVPRMEINAAYEALERRLGPLGLRRAGLKGERICLTFLTPEVARRHQGAIDDAANEVGYALYVHPHPNQHDLLEVLDRLCREHRVILVRTPSLHVDQRAIRLSPLDPVDPRVGAELRREVERACGYELRL